MLSASEGLQRDREVIATGSGIKVPVGDKTLGRLFKDVYKRQSGMNFGYVTVNGVNSNIIEAEIKYRIRLEYQN